MRINANEQEMHQLLQLLDIRLGEKQTGTIAIFDLTDSEGTPCGFYNKLSGIAELDINHIFDQAKTIL